MSETESTPPESVEHYVQRLLDLVDDADPTEIMTSTPALLRDGISDVPEEALSRAEAPGKWSIREVLRHLADAELVWAFGLRATITEDHPTLPTYDVEAWSTLLGYRRADPAHALDEFSAIRRGNLDLLGHLPSASFRRTAVHAERGEQTLAVMVRLRAGHDLAHLHQIRRLLGGFQR